MIRWELEWGPQVKTLQEIEKTTGITPKALQGRPTLRRDCKDYLAAFFELSPARLYNEAGQQPLQYTEIVAYLTEFGVSGEELRARFVRLIRKLDVAYMDFHFTKQSKSKP